MQQQKLFFPCKQDRFMHSFKHSSYLERVMFEVGMISRWGWQVPMNWLGQSPSSLYPPPEGTGYTWTYYSSVWLLCCDPLAHRSLSNPASIGWCRSHFFSPASSRSRRQFHRRTCSQIFWSCMCGTLAWNLRESKPHHTSLHYVWVAEVHKEMLLCLLFICSNYQ